MTYKELKKEVRAVKLAVECTLLLDELSDSDYCLSVAARRMECSLSTLSSAVRRHPILIELVKSWGPGLGRRRGRNWK